MKDSFYSKQNKNARTSEMLFSVWARLPPSPVSTLSWGTPLDLLSPGHYGVSTHQ